MSKRQRYLTEAAQHYAAFDRTDPFVLARMSTHARHGILGYQAAPFRVHRHYVNPLTGKTVEYTATEFRNIARP